MLVSVAETFRKYLRRDASLEDLREWLALNQWDLPEDEQSLVDEADAGLAHLDDGYGTETDFRIRLLAVLDQQGSLGDASSRTVYQIPGVLPSTTTNPQAPRTSTAAKSSYLQVAV